MVNALPSLGYIASRFIHPGANNCLAIILGQLKLGDRGPVAEDHCEATFEGDAVGANLPQQSIVISGSYRAIQGGRAGQRLSLSSGVCRGVLREFERHPGRALAKL